MRYIPQPKPTQHSSGFESQAEPQTPNPKHEHRTLRFGGHEGVLARGIRAQCLRNGEYTLKHKVLNVVIQGIFPN